MQYADDTALLFAGEDVPILQARVQSGLRSLSHYYDNLGIHPNPAKTSCVIYTKRHRRSPPPPTLQAAILSWSPVAKYLGEHLDAPLTWHHHIAVMVGWAKELLSNLSPVLTLACPLSQDDRVCLWRALVLPVLTYTAVVWAYAPPSCYRPVVWAYNAALRLILGHPCWTVVAALYEMAGVQSPAALIRQLASRFYPQGAAHFNPFIAEIGDYDIESPGPHRWIRDFLHDDPP
ncbi:hypothetical protein PR048_025186 [Dryococelus australis]|uniref:Reverse transcriptase domain-containing protein n=1 Tax=Dryococelus australis TaxID=614101 RepID=A0ABQ9GQN1_9NEOP|nr:hypothetical protein PR048_025186 [Dryococelus australis]